MNTSTCPGGSEVKASAGNAGDPGSIPGLERSPGEGNGNPLQYSCLENPMEGEAWWATVHGVANSQTRLSEFTSLHFTSTCQHALETQWLRVFSLTAARFKIPDALTQEANYSSAKSFHSCIEENEPASQDWYEE